jgi:hypothetical protein
MGRLLTGDGAVIGATSEPQDVIVEGLLTPEAATQFPRPDAAPSVEERLAALEAGAVEAAAVKAALVEKSVLTTKDISDAAASIEAVEAVEELEP